MSELSKSMQWTDLCNHMVGELHNKGFTPQQMNQALQTIPFNPAMASALTLAHSNGSDIVIISDANTVYIDQISKHYKIDHLFTQVITNKGYYNNDGRLCIEWFSKQSHGCSNGCALNICKGAFG
jgi:pyridoxal phosphate phosphatase PHOSPHO2